MVATNGNYEFVHFQTADALLAAIAPVSRLKTNTATPSFVYRGHGNATWALIPSALRSSGSSTNAISRVFGDPSEPTADNQVWAELRFLQMFLEECDRRTIAVPGDSDQFRDEWMNDQRGVMQTSLKFPKMWPHPPHMQPLAFAQHHGVPTRLLDWSLNPFVAAYFAGAYAIVEQPNTELAIWALNTEFLHLYERVRQIRVPGSNSARLGAQGGLFTLVASNADRGQRVDGTTFDEALVSDNEGASATKPLWKLVLPRSEAPRLLYLCHLYGVSAASVYPGPAGAATATLERMSWLQDDASGDNAANVRPVGLVDVSSERNRP